MSELLYFVSFIPAFGLTMLIAKVMPWLPDGIYIYIMIFLAIVISVPLVGRASDWEADQLKKQAKAEGKTVGEYIESQVSERVLQECERLRGRRVELGARLWELGCNRTQEAVLLERYANVNESNLRRLRDRAKAEGKTPFECIESELPPEMIEMGESLREQNEALNEALNQKIADGTITYAQGAAMYANYKKREPVQPEPEKKESWLKTLGKWLVDDTK